MAGAIKAIQIDPLLELGAEVTVHSLAALTRHPERNEQKNRLVERWRCG